MMALPDFESAAQFTSAWKGSARKHQHFEQLGREDLVGTLGPDANDLGAKHAGPRGPVHLDVSKGVLERGTLTKMEV